jgi:hypothetical protein
MQIYEEEEMYWFSRSSEKWLLEGDNNTSYFHRVANGRRRKNTMYSLKKDDIHIQGTADSCYRILQNAFWTWGRVSDAACRQCLVCLGEVV